MILPSYTDNYIIQDLMILFIYVVSLTISKAFHFATVLQSETQVCVN